MLENGSFLISDYFQARPQIEANIINATRMMLEEEFVPDITAKFNQEISVVEGTLHQHMEKIGSLESKDKALDSATILLELEYPDIVLTHDAFYTHTMVLVFDSQLFYQFVQGIVPCYHKRYGQKHSKY